MVLLYIFPSSTTFGNIVLAVRVGMVILRRERSEPNHQRMEFGRLLYINCTEYGWTRSDKMTTRREFFRSHFLTMPSCYFIYRFASRGDRCEISEWTGRIGCRCSVSWPSRRPTARCDSHWIHLSKVFTAIRLSEFYWKHSLYLQLPRAQFYSLLLCLANSD